MNREWTRIISKALTVYKAVLVNVHGEPEKDLMSYDDLSITAAIQNATDNLLDKWEKYGDNCSPDGILNVNREWTRTISKALTIYKAVLLNVHGGPEEKTEPLTLEELRQMGGVPYYHVGLQADSPAPHWAILEPHVAKRPEDYGYGKRWFAYRRKPEN